MKINYNDAHITLPEDNTDPLSIEFIGVKLKVWEGDKLSFNIEDDTWELIYTSPNEVIVKHNGNTIIQNDVGQLRGLKALFGDA